MCVGGLPSNCFSCCCHQAPSLVPEPQGGRCLEGEDCDGGVGGASLGSRLDRPGGRCADLEQGLGGPGGRRWGGLLQLPGEFPAQGQENRASPAWVARLPLLGGGLGADPVPRAVGSCGPQRGQTGEGRQMALGSTCRGTQRFIEASMVARRGQMGAQSSQLSLSQPPEQLQSRMQGATNMQ